MPRRTTRKNHVSWVKARRETALFNLERRHGRRPAEGDQRALGSYKSALMSWEREEREITTLKERIKYGSAA